MKTFRILVFIFMLLGWGALLGYLFFYQKTAPSPTLPQQKTPNVDFSKNPPFENTAQNTFSSIETPPKKIESLALSDEQCQSCHPEVYEEWRQSYHSQAWTNPDFQGYLGLYRPADCLPCHIPEPLLLQKDFSPMTRLNVPENGISCLTCHQMESGKIASLFSSSNAPHPIIQSKALVEDQLCIACHQSIGKTFLKHQQKEQSCRSCHMPEQIRANQKKGYSHLFLDRQHPEFLKRAIQVDISQTPELVEVQLSNPLIPHNIPGERHFRMLILFIEVYKQGQENPVASYREVIKDITMFRKESLQDKIQPNQTLSYSYPKNEGTSASIRLVYKRFPTVLDKDGQVVFSRQVDF